MKGVEFTIKSPLWAGIFSWAVLIIGILGLITGAVFMIPGIPIAFEVKMCVLIGGGALILFGALMLYVYRKERFSLKDGVFDYIKPFKKSQSARASEINHIAVYASGMLVRVVFYDKDHETLISFLDDGTAFRSGEFERALEAYGIPIFYQ